MSSTPRLHKIGTKRPDGGINIGNYNNGIYSKYKAPKSGRSHMVSIGQRYCKGVCERVKTNRPFGNPYPTHYFCSPCDAWIPLEHKKENGRCICCNRQVRSKAKGITGKKIG
ncbi:MAG: hypothetical protein ACE5Q4_03905 [Nitrosopumilus sp.]